jgi:uncharacterized protein YjeT (DUF2065 family)
MATTRQRSIGGCRAGLPTEEAERPTTTATPQAAGGAGRVERFARIVAVTAGVVFLVPGLWAFFAPASFFQTAATFAPYNAHFVRDLGAFQIGLGLVLVLAAVTRESLLAALAGVGAGASFHLAAHVIDRDLGGDPTVDLPTFGVVAVVLLGAAVARALSAREHRGAGLRRGGR